MNKHSQENLALFKPLDSPRGLTAELIARLTADIVDGKFPPGSQLPTEQEMIAATGVSRTVVREAVAALKADRLVVTRQGAGAFVVDHVRRPYRVDFDEHSPLRDVLNVMELRTGVEVEAAGLAAKRASPAQLKKITHRLEAINSALEKGGNAVDQDLAFHCEIADATGNPQFRRFLEYLGRFIIPRRTVSGRSQPPTNRHQLDLFQQEHEQIFNAIRARAVTQARYAMQRHLNNSRSRYEKLTAEIRIKPKVGADSSRTYVRQLGFECASHFLTKRARGNRPWEPCIHRPKALPEQRIVRLAIQIGASIDLKETLNDLLPTWVTLATGSVISLYF
jgi:GntR family transcriptional regulator, transcriptional repressor for pyruvate dehydrogenase complex